MSEKIKTYFEKSGAIIVRYKNGQPEVLLQYRGRNDLMDWSFPKGGMEEGETPEETAKREIREETGLEIEMIKVLPTLYYHNQHDGEVRQYMFLAKPITNETRPEFSRDKVEWVGLDKVAEKLSYQNLREYIEGIKPQLEDG